MPTKKREPKTKRHPDAIAFDAWMESEEGIRCSNPAGLKAPGDQRHYLENRLRAAFLAGCKSARVTIAPAPAMVKKGPERIKSQSKLINDTANEWLKLDPPIPFQGAIDGAMQSAVIHIGVLRGMIADLEAKLAQMTENYQQEEASTARLAEKIVKLEAQPHREPLMDAEIEDVFKAHSYRVEIVNAVGEYNVLYLAGLIAAVRSLETRLATQQQPMSLGDILTAVQDHFRSAGGNWTASSIAEAVYNAMPSQPQPSADLERAIQAIMDEVAPHPEDDEPIAQHKLKQGKWDQLYGSLVRNLSAVPLSANMREDARDVCKCCGGSKTVTGCAGAPPCGACGGTGHEGDVYLAAHEMRRNQPHPSPAPMCATEEMAKADRDLLAYLADEEQGRRYNCGDYNMAWKYQELARRLRSTAALAKLPATATGQAATVEELRRFVETFDAPEECSSHYKAKTWLKLFSSGVWVVQWQALSKTAGEGWRFGHFDIEDKSSGNDTASLIAAIRAQKEQPK